MLSEEVKETARRIAQFYLQKNSGNHEAAQEEILELRISKLEITDKGVAITTERPGILIGKRGTNIDALSRFLAKEVRIIEDRDVSREVILRLFAYRNGEYIHAFPTLSKDERESLISGTSPEHGD